MNKMTSSNDMESAVEKLRASLAKALATEQRLEAAVERAAVSEQRLTMTLAEHAAHIKNENSKPEVTTAQQRLANIDASLEKAGFKRGNLTGAHSYVGTQPKGNIGATHRRHNDIF